MQTWCEEFKYWSHLSARACEKDQMSFRPFFPHGAGKVEVQDDVTFLHKEIGPGTFIPGPIIFSSFEPEARYFTLLRARQTGQVTANVLDGVIEGLEDVFRIVRKIARILDRVLQVVSGLEQAG
jgi:hypothetical protein